MSNTTLRVANLSVERIYCNNPLMNCSNITASTPPSTSWLAKIDSYPTALIKVTEYGVYLGANFCLLIYSAKMPYLPTMSSLISWNLAICTPKFRPWFCSKCARLLLPWPNLRLSTPILRLGPNSTPWEAECDEFWLNCYSNARGTMSKCGFLLGERFMSSLGCFLLEVNLSWDSSSIIGVKPNFIVFLSKLMPFDPWELALLLGVCKTCLSLAPGFALGLDYLSNWTSFWGN